MNHSLITAFKHKDYNTIFAYLRPLFYKNLRQVPPALQHDFLQEYYLACIKIIENFQSRTSTNRKE